MKISPDSFLKQGTNTIVFTDKPIELPTEIKIEDVICKTALFYCSIRSYENNSH